MSWDHGYYSEGTYTSNFYRELAPNWIDFALLVKGQQPPRRKEGVPFTYLELGCGMAAGLCLLAAAYPEGTFLGVDFQPDHVVHGQWLAAELGLANIRIQQADFIALRHDPAPLGLASDGVGTFDYVVAHGIATWVVEPVQQALLAVAAAALRPGGAFLCSYNTYPGWLGLSAFRQLSELERERHDPSSPEQAYRAAATTLAALLGQGKGATPLGQSLPRLHPDLMGLPWHQPNYLCQEYASQGWAPLYVAEMHRRCRRHQLRYMATATLPELFDEFLLEEVRATVLQESNPDLRQTLLDLATNKSFRRDLFVHGRLMPSRPRRDEALAGVRLRLQESPPLETYLFPSSFGDIVGDGEAYVRLEKALGPGPLALADLRHTTLIPEQELLPMVTLLLHVGRLGLDRGEAGARAQDTCLSVNATLLRLMREGETLGHLAAPAIGSGIGFTPLEALSLQAQAEGLSRMNAAACMLMGVAATGQEVRDAAGQPLADQGERLRRLEEICTRLWEDRLPRLRDLGVLPGRPPAPAEGRNARRKHPAA
jgi:SAM-dependent methyltransferase